MDVLYVVRDITEEKLRELMYQKQLKASMEDAQRANISKTAFLQRMSHDIRTPLNGIVGMIHIAEKYKNDVDKLRECRQKALQSTDYLQKLINNVLDISKLESGSLMLEYKSFDLVELLNNNMTVVAMSAYENGVRFEGGVEANTIRHRYLIGSPVHLMTLLHRDAERNMRNFRGRLFIGVLYKGITPDIIFWPHVRVIENGVIFLLRSGSLHFLLLGEMMRI